MELKARIKEYKNVTSYYHYHERGIIIEKIGGHQGAEKENLY